jgi:segregation and condensation protein A
MAYKVKLNFFEGPLDLLLFLIKRDRIDVYDIPIATITEQYLAYLELMKLMDLDVAGEFLVMAAQLIYIKSKMLLPPDEEALEEAKEEDPRDELVRRLLEYKKFKEAASQLSEMKDHHKEIFPRTGAGEKDKVFVEGEDGYFEASLFDLISAFRDVLKDVPREIFHEVVKDRYTVREKIDSIINILSGTPRIMFKELLKAVHNRDEVIATFLAILELIKMRYVLIVQKERYSEIMVMKSPEMSGEEPENEENMGYA